MEFVFLLSDFISDYYEANFWISFSNSHKSCIKKPLASNFEPHYENEAVCKVVIMEISFHSYANKTNFHMKSFALSFAFVMRFKQLGNGLLKHVYTMLERPSPFATSSMVGRENKTTNNRTMLPALKNNAAAGYQGPVKIELLQVCWQYLYTQLKKENQTHRGRGGQRKQHYSVPNPRGTTQRRLLLTLALLFYYVQNASIKRERPNLVPRVLWLFGQRVVATTHWPKSQRTLGTRLKNSYLRDFPGDEPLAEEPEDSGHEIERGQVPIHPRVYTLTAC